MSAAAAQQASRYIFSCRVHHTDSYTCEQCFAQHPELSLDWFNSKPSVLEFTKSSICSTAGTAPSPTALV